MRLLALALVFQPTFPVSIPIVVDSTTHYVEPLPGKPPEDAASRFCKARRIHDYLGCTERSSRLSIFASVKYLSISSLPPSLNLPTRTIHPYLLNSSRIAPFSCLVMYLCTYLMRVWGKYGIYSIVPTMPCRFAQRALQSDNFFSSFFLFLLFFFLLLFSPL